jgi:hypothetical protein
MTKKQASFDYTPEFEQFWKHYPRRQNSQGAWIREGKYEAMIIWNQMCVEDRKHALYAVILYEKSRPKLPKDACRWLKYRRYDDTDMPEEEGQHLPASMTTVLKNVANETKPVNVNNERNRQLAALKGAKND